MNDLAKIEGENLSEQQARFVALIVEGVEPDEAKAKAGYSERTPTVGILRSKVVENAIRAGCDAELNGPLRVKAMLRLKRLIEDEKTPAATAFNAAKLIIERGDDQAHDGDKPLREMDMGELEAMVARLEEEREARMKNVTPKNGA